MTDRLRVLAVNAVDALGGAEIGLLRLLDRRPDWEVTLTTPGDGPLREAARERGLATASLPVGGLAARAGARAIASLPHARRLAAAHDVTYLNGTVAARLLPALRGRRTVLHVHDMVTRVPRRWRHADVVLADSEAVARRLRPQGLHPEVVFCPIPLELPPPADPPWPREPAGPIVGFVGRIEPRKGPDLLVAAAERLRASHPTARVILVGGDPFASDPGYSRTVRRSDAVEHVGWVTDAPSLMPSLALLVVPSREEPFGTVAAEALAAGTPVVAAAVDGLPEVVTDGVDGVLVAPGDPEALAAGIARALDSRDALAANARGSAARFDADRYAERVGALVRG